MGISPTNPTPVKQEFNRKWFILLAIGIASMMSSLDSSVVNIVLPIIRDEFHAEVATIEWVVVLYLLVVSCLLLTFGRLGDMIGHKKVFIFGFGLFIAGSVSCGFSQNEWALIISRGFQAIGGAILLSNATAILTHSFPPNQRGRALGLQGTMIYLGLTIGPSLGGWLTNTFNWRAVFFINVPVGLIGFLAGFFVIPKDVSSGKQEAFDLRGALVFMAGLVALMLGLNQGSEWGWTSYATLGLLLFAVLMGGWFIKLEKSVKQPMLDLNLFKKRVFSAGILSAIFNYICIYIVIFLMPFYLLQGRGMDPIQAGVLLTAQPLIMAVAAPISGAFSDRIGSRLLATSGMVILGIGLFLLSRLGPTTDSPFMVLALAITGLGTGIFVSPNNSAVMGAAPLHQQGIAAGTLATSRNLGMVLGVGLAGAVMTSILVSSSPESLFLVIEAGFIMAGCFALAGAFTSSLRGKSETPHS